MAKDKLFLFLFFVVVDKHLVYDLGIRPGFRGMGERGSALHIKRLKAHVWTAYASCPNMFWQSGICLFNRSKVPESDGLTSWTSEPLFQLITFQKPPSTQCARARIVSSTAATLLFLLII